MVSLPYISSPGNIAKALDGIKNAAVPEKVNQDFVKTILKIPGGSGDQMTSFLKKLGFAESDGSPTKIYSQFRNPTTAGAAIAAAIRKGYSPLYIRNEYMHELDDQGLVGLIMEETGQPHDASPVKLTLSALKALKPYANFSKDGQNSPPSNLPEVGSVQNDSPPKVPTNSVGLNLGYTININLPATTDQSVYNAIFKSIRENLLSSDDAWAPGWIVTGVFNVCASN